MRKSKGIAFKLAFCILTSCTFIFIVIFGCDYLLSRKMIVKNIKSSAENLSLLTVNKIESILLPIQKIPQNLAYSLEVVSYSKDELLELLRSVVENNSEVYGAAIAFAPYAFDRGSQYFAPYFYKSGAQIKSTSLSDGYQYWLWDWYQIPRELGKPAWSEPYYDEGAGNIIMATYSVPFYKSIDGKKEFMGVITADISLSWLQDIVSSIKIGRTGYGFVLSQNGRIVTYPVREFVMNETIFDLAEARKDLRLRVMGQEMVNGKSGVVVSNSIVTGKKCWIAYTPLKASGWSLGVVFPEDELMADMDTLNHIVLLIGIAGFLFLWLVIAWIAGSITRPIRSLSKTTKDIARGNLHFDLSGISSQDEVGELAQSFIYMRNALKKYIDELTQATVSKERLESELRIAHDIQVNLVEKKFPAFPGRHEFDIYALLDPAKEVGGDFYDFFFLDHDHLCFVIADVVGKGVPAALFMAMTKILIRITAKELKSPEMILDKVNAEICMDNKTCMFITVFCAIMDTKSGEVCYANAGHDLPFIIRSGKNPELLTGAGALPVGLDERSVYEKARVVLHPQDTIFLYTDGVTEAFNAHQEQFQEERLKSVLFVNQNDPPEKLVNAVAKDIKVFTQDYPQSDDITLLAIKYLPLDRPEDLELKDKRTFVFNNDISCLEAVKGAWFRFAKENDFCKTVIQDVSLAIEEVAANIIFYAYKDKSPHEIILSFSLHNDSVWLEFRDDGSPFNPLEYPALDTTVPVEKRPVGGMGIYIARNCMDELKYHRIEGENVLLMKKKVSFNR